MRVWLLACTAPLLFSCAKVLSVGHENFKCEATEGTGVCGTMEYVYENHEKLQLLNGKQSQTQGSYIEIKGEGNKVVLIGVREVVRVCEMVEDDDPIEPEEEMVCTYKPKLVIKKFKDEMDPLPAKPVPVREEALVQRIWIYPYVDKSGNLVEGHFIYTIIREGRWLDHRGREVD
ncbi:MAG: type IV conjugative transfer system lipoprotein TraV [Aquificota bacterium]|nr:type IV conjugative transfer system lipoprotein TraV [Aquificota bacterium]